jgi:hypothetical protein
LGYVHLQKTSTAEETLEAKAAWEAFARSHGLSIKAYHADNGIFKANKWVDSCKRDNQGLTFAGVNSHHENGIAERRIKEIQEGARTMIIHANHRWKNSVNAHLWPYAVRMASDQINSTPNMQRDDKQSPMQVFARTDVHCNVKHWHHFGSPVYVLERELQTNAPFDKWRARAKVGIYLGRSPQHSRNVALVLSQETGLVSPQYHVKHDSGFDTVKEEKPTDRPAPWMVKAGFVGRIESSTERGSKRKANGSSRSDEPGEGEPRQKAGRTDFGNEGIGRAAGYGNAGKAPMEQELPPRPDADGQKQAGPTDFENEGIGGTADYGNVGKTPMEQELPPMPEAYGDDDTGVEGRRRGSWTPRPPSSNNPFESEESAPEVDMRESEGRGTATARSGRATRARFDSLKL